MIPDEQRGRIRRLFFAEHWKVGTIATELGVHHDTVELAIEPRRFVNRGLYSSVTLLDAYLPFVAQTLEQYPRLRATRLFEMIRDRGYKGSVYAVRRHVRRVRPAHHEAFFRLTVLPGEQAQVDWGSFGKIRVGQGERALCSLGRAPRSRVSRSTRPSRASFAATSRRSSGSAAFPGRRSTTT
jgi:transposase